MLEPELLRILVCPETKQSLALLDRDTLAELNARIQRSSLLNRGGGKITEVIEAALVREDRLFAYPIRKDIPIMLIDEAVALNKGAA